MRRFRIFGKNAEIHWDMIGWLILGLAGLVIVLMFTTDSGQTIASAFEKMFGNVRYRG